MSNNADYKIIFSGQTTGEFDISTSKARFAKIFKLDEERTEKLFSGKRFTIKKNVSREEALKYALRISQAGCDCVIERVMSAEPAMEGSNHPGPSNIYPIGDNTPGTPGFVERRLAKRRLRFRRAPRPGAIIPDRRSGKGRRSTD